MHSKSPSPRHYNAQIGARALCLESLLGMAENHRSRTLGQSEPTEKKLVPADRPIKKAEFALVCLQDLVVFFHKTLPSWQIDGQLLPIAAPGPMAEYKL